MIKRKRKRRIKSHGELEICKFLDKYKIKYIREAKFDTCRSLKNRMLRFDFYLQEYNLAIEYQGQHHYYPISNSSRAKYVHNKTKLHDTIKKKFCLDNNIFLLEIGYLDKSNISLILENLLKK